MQREVETDILHDAVGRCCEERFCEKACEIRQRFRPADVAEAVLRTPTPEEIVYWVSRCALCGRCTQMCPNGVDGKNIMKYARFQLVEKGAIDAEAYRHLWIDHDWNVLTLFRDRHGLDEAYRPWNKDRCTAVFMPSCMLANEAPQLVHRAAEWLTGQGEDVKISVDCCGAMLDGIGVQERTEEYSDELWKGIRKTGARRVVTACPTCQQKMLDTRNNDPANDGIAVVSLFQLMAEAGVRVAATERRRITVHDSCGDRQGQVGSHVRTLLKDHKLVEMRHRGKNTICCGSGGLVTTIDPELSQTRAQRRLREVEKVQADTCVTYCMGCAHTLSGAGSRRRVSHILELVFNETVDHARFDAMGQALFEGERSLENHCLLQHSRPVNRSARIRPKAATST